MDYPSITIDGKNIVMQPPKARLYAVIRKHQGAAEEGKLEAYAEIVAAAFRIRAAGGASPVDAILDNLGGGELIGTAMRVMKIVNDSVAEEFERFPELKNALERVQTKEAI